MVTVQLNSRIGFQRTNAWSVRLATRVLMTDLLVLVWVVFGTQIAWLGADTTFLGGVTGARSDIEISYTIVSVALIACWMLALQLYDTRSFRVLGSGGPQEYRSIGDATVRVFGLVAIVAFLIKVDVARGYILIAFPLGLGTLIVSRWLWRQWLGVKRRQGEYSSRVLLAGSAASISTIARELASAPDAGYRVVGACLRGAGALTHIPPGTDVKVYADVDRVLESCGISAPKPS